MTMFLLRFFSLVGVLLVLITTGESEQVALVPQQLWDEAVAFKGGRDRLHAVDSLVISLDSSRGGSARDPVRFAALEIVLSLPGSFWMWDDYRPGPIGFGVMTFNSDKRQHWLADNGGVAQAVEVSDVLLDDRDAMIEMWQLVYLLESRFIAPRELVLAVGPSRTGYVSLEGRAKHYSKIRYDIELATKRVNAITLWQTTVPSAGHEPTDFESGRYVFEGEQIVDHIRLPKAVRGLGSLSVTVNPRLDTRLFETKPDNVNSRTEWRKWLR